MDQENLPAPSNPLGMQGVEFIEYTTREPLALGSLLQQFGFMPVARHRSREVMLYRQGDDEHHRRRRRGERSRVGARQRADHRRGGVPRARRGVRASPRAGARRVGHADARRRDGNEHPRHPRCRRQPHLFRRASRRAHDLRRRFRAHRRRRPRSAGARRHALVRPGAGGAVRPRRRLGRFLRRAAGLRAAASAGSTSACCPRERCWSAPMAASISSSSSRRRAPISSSGTKRCCASVWARPT